MDPAGPSIRISQLPRAFWPSSSADKPSRRRSSMALRAHSRDGIGTTTLSEPGPTTRLPGCKRWRPDNFDAAVLLRRLLDAGHVNGRRRQDLVGGGHAGAAVERLAAPGRLEH